jgi:hypothetical protein
LAVAVILSVRTDKFGVVSDWGAEVAIGIKDEERCDKVVQKVHEWGVRACEAKVVVEWDKVDGEFSAVTGLFEGELQEEVGEPFGFGVRDDGGVYKFYDGELVWRGGGVEREGEGWVEGEGAEGAEGGGGEGGADKVAAAVVGVEGATGVIAESITREQAVVVAVVNIELIRWVVTKIKVDRLPAGGAWVAAGVKVGGALKQVIGFSKVMRVVGKDEPPEILADSSLVVVAWEVAVAAPADACELRADFSHV